MKGTRGQGRQPGVSEAKEERFGRRPTHRVRGWKRAAASPRFGGVLVRSSLQQVRAVPALPPNV